MSDARIVTESLGGSPLSRRGRAGELPQWFVTPPSTSSGWQSYAGDVIASVHSDWLERVGPAIAARGAAAERLARSANGKGLVVTTGQQPGLFGGPLMTLAKALTARALADVLQQTTGLPVAPIFWAATDDADFVETASVSLSLDGGARALMLEQRTPAGVPSSRVPMGDDIETLMSLLQEACGSAPSANYLERALAAYRTGATIGDAYVSLLRDVLEPLEIAVLDVSHERMAAASADVMQRAAKRASLLASAVQRRDADIREAGFTPQVEEVPGLSHVFVNSDGTKRRLTQAEATEFTPRDGEWLSSTVLLRPVLERALLPTAAYVAGPGEFAYFAQVTAVADALELPRPLAVPRWSTTIIEPRVQKMLNALDVSETDLADPHAVETRLARAELPADTASALEALRSDTLRAVDRLRDDDATIVPREVIDGLRRDLGHRLDRLERRYVAGVKRRETDLMRRIATARGALYPHGIRQERKLAWLPFLARGGAPLIEHMLEAAREHARGIVSPAPSLRGTAGATAAPSTARV